MVYNSDDILFENHNGKIVALERMKGTKILCVLSKGSLIEFECPFNFEKYKKEWERLKKEKGKTWSDNLVQDVATILGAEKYPWGMKLKTYKVQNNYNHENMSSYTIKFTVEV